MRVKVAELIGSALDWAVAKVEKHQSRCEWMLEKEGFYAWQSYERAWGTPIPLYSSDWTQGGPIMERESISVSPCSIVRPDAPWMANSAAGNVTMLGPTPLIAAMRCYVASKLGEDIEIPDELLKGK